MSNIWFYFKRLKDYGIKNSAYLTKAILLKRLYYEKFTDSYSQYGEDIIIDKLLRFPPNGFYVDVGSCDPVILNNTKRFYDRGWSGINIDLYGDNIQKFNKLRPRDINIQSGVSDHAGEMEAYQFYQMNSFTFCDEYVFKNIENGCQVKEKVVIKVQTLEQIFDKHLPLRQKIDFISIDTEGLDLKVINGNNWEKYRSRVICIEQLHPSDKKYGERQEEFLKKCGYKKVKTNGLNSFYIDTKLVTKLKKPKAASF